MLLIGLPSGVAGRLHMRLLLFEVANLILAIWYMLLPDWPSVLMLCLLVILCMSLLCLPSRVAAHLHML